VERVKITRKTKGVITMRRPKKMNFKKSKKLFSRTAAKTNRKNSMRGTKPLRGGIRL